MGRHQQPPPRAHEDWPTDRQPQSHAFWLCREHGVEYAVEHLQIDARAGVFDYGQYVAILIRLRAYPYDPRRPSGCANSLYCVCDQIHYDLLQLSVVALDECEILQKFGLD